MVTLAPVRLIRTRGGVIAMVAVLLREGRHEVTEEEVKSYGLLTASAMDGGRLSTDSSRDALTTELPS